MSLTVPDIQVDVAANRAASKYRPREQLARALWSIGRLIVRFSPKPMFAWRRCVLRAFGARIGEQVNISASARIYLPWMLEIGDWSAVGDEAYIYNLGRVSIGQRVTVSYRAHICAGTHDFSVPDLPLLRPETVIEDDVWIGTDAFLGPGVTIGKNALVGARSVVVKDVAERHVVAGNPARQIGWRKGPPSAARDAGNVSSL